MIVKEINVKGIITKSNLPDAEFVINPYIGCQHACIYCYAEFMKRFTNHHEKWGSFVDVKINAIEVLKNTKKIEGRNIFLSSVTDPYQPLEAKYKLTRKILEALIEKQPKIEILTKSALISKDIDLLKKYNSAVVGVSISTMDEKLSRQLEPFTSSPRLRIEAVKKCKKAGLKTYIFLSPIFPYITDIEQIMKASSKYADCFMFENLNLRQTNMKKIYEFLRINKPELVQKYKEIYENKNNSYWKDTRKQIIKLGEKYGRKVCIYFHHGGFDK